MFNGQKIKGTDRLVSIRASNLCFENANLLQHDLIPFLQAAKNLRLRPV
jgi:hypothetical protein